MEYTLYVAVVLALLLSLFAQIYVSSTFRRYSRMTSFSAQRAEDVARYVLDEAGCQDVTIERVHGSLTDHYDPRTKTLRLSDSTYGNASAAAIGVACHEAGHAIQHRENYFPVRVRSALVPITNFVSRFWSVFIVISMIFLLFVPNTTMPGASNFGYYFLLCGIGVFSVNTVFQLVTLPCEFDASRRALGAMRRTGYFDSHEVGVAKKVLSAAAMTYIASALVSVLHLLRLISIARRGRR